MQSLPVEIASPQSEPVYIETRSYLSLVRERTRAISLLGILLPTRTDFLGLALVTHPPTPGSRIRGRLIVNRVIVVAAGRFSDT
jgi:hypothetical protein